MRGAFQRTVAMLLATSIAAAALPVSAQDMGGGGDTGPTKAPVLTKAPKLVKFVEADYPEKEKKAGKAAAVVLQIAISDKGVVEDVVVTGSAGAAFDAAAIKATKQFVFEAAEIDGKPAPVKITYRYDFVIKEEPKGPVTNFEGIVKDRFTKKPLAGVKVTVDTLPSVTTDDSGHFSFADLATGKHTVTLEGQGFTTVSTEETIEEKKKLEVKYSVEPKEEVAPGEEAPDLEVVVVAPKIVKEVLSTEIKAEEGKRVAGTGGDTLKVVQNLPGVARASFGSGALVVWGAAPQDTRVYLDGVRIPALYHVGGLRSTINSDFVRGIELAPGGWGAEYGRGLGGLVTVDTRALRSDKLHGYVAADAIDASAMLEAPIDSKTRAAAAFRKSYLERSLSLFTKEDVSEFIPIPSYWDGQLKIERDLGRNETVTLLGIASSDTLVRTVPSVDPALVKSQRQVTEFGRIILSYRKQLDDGSSVNVTPSIGLDHQSSLSKFGGAPTELDASGTAFGIRAGWRGRVAPFLVMSTGLDFENFRTSLSRRGAVTVPPREGDVSVFGQPPGDQVNADDWQTSLSTIGPYAQADFSLFGDRLHLVPGARIEAYITSGSRMTPIKGETPSIGYTHEETYLEPRLSARFQASSRLMLKGAFGVYHQSPQADDLSAVFGNPNLGPSTATHGLLGFAFKLTEKLSVEATGFLSRSHDLTSRSQAETPLLAQALVQEGEGRAYGGQLLLRQELAKGFFGWASYSIIRSERRDHPSSDWRLFDYDQTHVATVVGSYELGRGFEVGVRVRYATGFPRTPVVGSFYEARRDLYEPYFGKQNSIRVPAFVQADVRFAKRFTFGVTKVETFLDVQNVTNRPNREEIVYSYDYKKRDYVTGLPILPVVGARFEW